MQDNTAEKETRYRKTKQILGEGSYKTVTKAVDEEEGKEVAYNEVRIKNYEDETQTATSFSKEVALLRSIDHPNIIRILDYWFSGENFIFITELMTGGSLRDYIQKNGPLSAKLIRKWGRQILEGLAYLHGMEQPIIHRDIKNENIFVNTAIGEVKIGDLGLARERKHKRYTIVGTPHFMAREMFEGEGYTEKVDVYAFGMCLIEMATGRMPYIEFKDTTDIYKNVLQGIQPRALQAISDACLKSLVVGCLAASDVRFTATQCLEHHFFDADVKCGGDCITGESVAVFPLQFQPVKNMELSIVSVEDKIAVFQILLLDTMKFVKFEYNLALDSVERICEELITEKIVGEDSLEAFSKLLRTGLATVAGEAQEGDGSPLRSLEFGVSTLEEMKLIEENMKIEEAKREIERKIEEELAQRLKSKLKADFDSDTTCSVEVSKTVKFKNDPPPEELVSENIYLQFPNAPEDIRGVDWEQYSVKYQNNCPVLQCVQDVALITGRSEEAAKTWAKALREEDIESVFDLKLIVYEDWEKLPLTVFSCRALQNILYGVGGVPMKERQQPLNPKVKEYDSKLPIKTFLEDVCGQIGRRELVSRWGDRLLAQDIQTVGELKSLHNEDWGRLGLTVYAYRVLKNVIFRKGKIVID